MGKEKILTGSDAFDKGARLLNLTSSTEASGAVIERYASLPPLSPSLTHPADPLPLSIPEKTRTAFSFSGTVSALERRLSKLRDDGIEEEAIQREMSRVFQTAVVGHLCMKLRHAMDTIRPEGGMGGLVVSGGVASNQYLRTQYVQVHPCLCRKVAYKIT